MRFTASCLTLLLALALAAVPAGAEETNAPPGNSGLSQYLEVVPSARGNTPSTRKQSDGVSRPQLASEGEDGERLDALAGPDSEPDDRDGSRTTDDQAALTSDAAQSRAAAVTGTIGGSGSSFGLGLWMPIAMAVLAAVALLAGWRRRSRSAAE